MIRLNVSFSHAFVRDLPKDGAYIVSDNGRVAYAAHLVCGGYGVFPVTEDGRRGCGTGVALQDLEQIVRLVRPESLSLDRSCPPAYLRGGSFDSVTERLHTGPDLAERLTYTYHPDLFRTPAL